MHTLYFLRRMQYRDVMCQLIIEVGGLVKNDCGHRVGVFWECATCKIAMCRPCTQQSMKHFGYVNCMCKHPFAPSAIHVAKFKWSEDFHGLS
jgi:hypothetical protein